jgi:hypothetical protein
MEVEEACLARQIRSLKQHDKQTMDPCMTSPMVTHTVVNCYRAK